MWYLLTAKGDFFGKTLDTRGGDSKFDLENRHVVWRVLGGSRRKSLHIAFYLKINSRLNITNSALN
jgi:hypothetical protein